MRYLPEMQRTVFAVREIRAVAYFFVDKKYTDWYICFP